MATPDFGAVALRADRRAAPDASQALSDRPMAHIPAAGATKGALPMVISLGSRLARLSGPENARGRAAW